MIRAMIRTTLTTATQQRNPQGNSQRETPPISIKTRPITPIIDTARMFTARMRRISAILIMSVLVILISACEGGSRNNSAGGDVPPEDEKKMDPISVLNLRVIPDENNATLIWNNPDADIASINISYKLSTADIFGTPTPITDDAKIAANAIDVREMITSLISNTTYTFRVTLELKGADKDKSVMAREITRLTGLNLDGDEYADGDPSKTDEDGDSIGALPRNPTSSAFAVTNLRVIPDKSNATLIWNNPDADIANINISYKLSTADIFGTPIPITDDARIARNKTDVMGMILEGSLTPNTNYTFRVTLELKGADENKSVMAREITRLIGPNLDGDDYADDDPLETDEDGDGIDDEEDKFPRNPTLYAFAVSNLRVIPDEKNATIRWNNPDADIANINISYKLSTADNFTLPISITDNARIARNATDVMEMITPLTPNRYYTFRVTLEFGRRR